MDFVGHIRASRRQLYPYPLPDRILTFASTAIQELLSSLTDEQRHRVCGIGIATPFELWNWSNQVGAKRGEMEAWRKADLASALGEKFGLPVFTQNDATAACGAERVFGRGTGTRDFVYFFIGSFVGGGVVINGMLYTGPSGNAGALGSMPVAAKGGGIGQLIEEASVFLLEEAVLARGLDPSGIWQDPDHWEEYGGLLADWIGRTARALAQAIAAACSVIDFPLVIIDGVMPDDVRARLVDAIHTCITGVNFEGIAEPAIIEGQLGVHARTIGGASLPLFERFLLDARVLVKEAD
jgi:predicted NBD/HSP70 family sugar kinase